LLSLVRTLENVPAECLFSVHLSYVSGTPPDYEPPFFEAGDAKEVGAQWSKNPFSMHVGKVETTHHGLSLRVRSTLDPALDTDSGSKPELGGSSETSSIIENDHPQLTLTPVGVNPQSNHDFNPSQELLGTGTLSQPMAATEPEHVDLTPDEMDRHILAWIIAQQAFTFIDSVACAKQLKTFSFRAIGDTFKRLELQGKISRDDSKGFIIVTKTPAPMTKNTKSKRKTASDTKAPLQSTTNIRKRLRSANK